MKKHFDLLCCRVKDVFTDKEGVATSIAFDATGCISALINCKKEDGTDDAFWVDITRIRILSDPLIKQPDWNDTKIASGEKGSCYKPLM